ncbi:MAG: sensor of ECF-type sigma factor [Lutimonas sp.]
MKRAILFGIVFCVSIATWGQGRGQLERIKAFKTGYLTEKLELSSAEAEKFWPIYNKYEKKIFELRIEKRKAEREKISSLGGPEALSDEEATEFLDSLFQNETVVLKTKQELYQELEQVLSPKKLLKLYKAEADFNRRLLSEFKRRGPNHQGN